MSIKWQADKMRVGDLLPLGWENNPRFSTAQTAEELNKQIDEYGQYYEILVDGTGIVDGHQRAAAWAKGQGHDFVVEIKRASRDLTEEERRVFTVRNHLTAMGQWSWDELANWDLPSLLPLDFADDWLKQLNYDGAMVATMLGAESVFNTPTDPANDPWEEWEGMPEFENDPKATRTIYVHFATDEDVKRFAERIGQSFTDKTKSIWYPMKADNIHMDKRLSYENES